MYSFLTAGPGSANLNCATVGVGDSCSIFAGSPLILTKSSNGTTITFAVAGTVTDGHGVTPWQGAFVGSIAGQTSSQILLFFCSTGICTPSDFTSGKSLSLSQSGDFLVPLVSGVDLTVTKSDGVTSAVPGTTTHYTIEVTNQGTDTVVGATVTDSFPPAITAAT